MSKTGSFLLGTIIGAATASVAALLLAPKSGKELQAELDERYGLTDKFGNYMDYAQEKTAGLTEQANHLYGQIKEKSTDSLEKAKESTEGFRENFKNQTDQIASKLKASKDDIDEDLNDLEEDIVIDSKEVIDNLKEDDEA